MLLLSSAYLPFTIALGLVAVLAVLEAVSALVGTPVSGVVEDAMPDFEVDADFDADVEGSLDGAMDGSPLQMALAWFSFGKVPVLVLLILALLGFGAAGLLLQMGLRTTVGTVAPAWLAALPGLAGAGLSMRIFGSALARAIPKDETEAVSRETLIGRPGVVTGGIARRGLPAQIRVPDAFGMNHYLLAEPEDEAEQLPIGTSVIVVSIEDNRGRVMRDPMMTVGTAQNQ